MFSEPDTLIGLCVGTTKISVIVAERDPRSREAVQIIGIGSAPAEGIRKGLIVNMEQAVRSVRSAVRDAHNIVGFELTEAVVAFDCFDVLCDDSDGTVSLGRNAQPQPVKVDDVERAIEVAESALSIPGNRLPLHKIPVRYSIDDGNFAIDDPLGITGMRLKMELQTVSVPMTYVHNVVRCVKSAGVDVEGLVIKPIASALGALTYEEMRVGVISVCIGGGTTGLTFYREGHPIKVGIVPIGGDHITNDLASVLRLPLKKAEDLKKHIFTAEGDDLIAIASKGQPGNTIDKNTAVETIGCRLEELFMVHVAPLIPDQNLKRFPGGIVLSGGVAKTPGIEGLVSDIFKAPVRVADSQEYYSMPPGRVDPSYVSAVGTIRYILSKERNPHSFIDAPRTLWNTSILQPNGGWSKRGAKQPEPRPYVPEEQSEGSSVGSKFKNMIEKIKETLQDLF